MLEVSTEVVVMVEAQDQEEQLEIRISNACNNVAQMEVIQWYQMKEKLLLCVKRSNACTTLRFLTWFCSAFSWV